jgi:hypothetical protein
VHDICLLSKPASRLTIREVYANRRLLFYARQDMEKLFLICRRQ